ncbi:MAG: HAMP domain-containing histidine kinase [Roseburia sp.]|nr:HAMP domain-containing histidine kinase [Roseburia sp.]MCM1097493.1 HAMP domain-containing histidine kinase [Ruminococcus flavefaciens]
MPPSNGCGEVSLNLLLGIALCIALFGVALLAARLRRVREQLSMLEEALEDIKTGNANRRILAKKDDPTAQICFSVNEIAQENQSQLIRQKQSEQSYKRLMSSLSHDVRTPLASLIGYLEAMEKGLVTGEEKDVYLRIALEKAHRLKHFIEALFEWVKLDAKEQILHIERCDINELTRNIAAEWIPAIEQGGFAYEIKIPEEEYPLCVDPQAYTRIINNLLQNTLIHSGGNRLTLQLSEREQQIELTLADNGKGISPSDLPHIFERLYQCDPSRTSEGNGLGLAITRELVSALGGTIQADNRPEGGATFTILFPKAL